MSTITPYYKNLDALRFLAFWGVFVSHTLTNLHFDSLPIEFLIHVLSFGYLGVPFFFTLSSFLITKQLLDEKEQRSTIGLLRFYKNRILRIWPLYFLIILIGFCIIPAIMYLLQLKPIALPALKPFLLFYVNYYVIQHGANFTIALLVLWSISIEEQFYFIWAPSIKSLPTKHFPLFIGSLYLVSVGYTIYQISHQANPHNLAIDSICIVQYFCSGAAVAFIVSKRNSLYNKLIKIHKWIWLSLYLLLPVLTFFTEVYLIKTIILCLFYFLLLFNQTNEANAVFNFSKFRFINHLGKISYGLYMYHALAFLASTFLYLEIQKHLSFSETSAKLIVMAITFLSTLIIAQISFKFFETPFLKLKENYKSN